MRRTVRAGLWAALAIALPFWLVMWNGEIILRALGQDPHLSALAGSYLRVLQWSALPFFVYLVLRSFMAALERPGWSLAAVVIGLLVNAGLNWLFIFGHWGFPAMGLPGSGLATALSTVLMAGILAVVAAKDRQFARFRPFSGLWRPDLASFRAVWRIGLPIGAMLAFEVTIFNAAVFLMGLIGPAPLAAHAIAIQIASLAFMIPLGLGQAATVRVGHAYGAGDQGAITRAGWTAYGLGVGTMVMTATVMVLFPRALIGAFLDIGDPANAAVVAQAVVFLGIAALFQIVDGAQAVAAGMLRGLHDTRVPMIYAALGYWGLGLPLGIVLAFPAGFGGAGIWTGLASALAVVAALMTWRWMQRDRLNLMRRR
ncbi:MAG: MATE family efflux transporter [Alsobacter sp.]